MHLNDQILGDDLMGVLVELNIMINKESKCMVASQDSLEYCENNL